jgi:hypothetical protein
MSASVRVCAVATVAPDARSVSPANAPATICRAPGAVSRLAIRFAMKTTPGIRISGRPALRRRFAESLFNPGDRGKNVHGPGL